MKYLGRSSCLNGNETQCYFFLAISKQTHTQRWKICVHYILKPMILIWSGMCIYIKNIVSKTKYLVYVFYRLKETLTKKPILQAYYKILHLARYGIIRWGGIYAVQLQDVNSWLPSSRKNENSQAFLRFTWFMVRQTFALLSWTLRISRKPANF